MTSPTPHSELESPLADPGAPRLDLAAKNVSVEKPSSEIRSTQKTTRQLASEVIEAKRHMMESIDGFKHSVSPGVHLKALTTKPSFPISVGMATMGAFLAVIYKVTKEHRRNRWMRKLPERLQDYLVHAREETTKVRDRIGHNVDAVPSRRKVMAKKAASIAWKVATPVMLSLLRRHFAPKRPVPASRGTGH